MVYLWYSDRSVVVQQWYNYGTVIIYRWYDNGITMVQVSLLAFLSLSLPELCNRCAHILVV